MGISKISAFDEPGVALSYKEEMLEKAKEYGLELWQSDDSEIYSDANCKTLIKAMEEKIPLRFIDGHYSWGAIEAMIECKAIGLSPESFKITELITTDATKEQAIAKVTKGKLKCDSCRQDVEVDLLSEEIKLIDREIITGCPHCGVIISLDRELLLIFEISIDTYLKWLINKQKA